MISDSYTERARVTHANAGVPAEYIPQLVYVHRHKDHGQLRFCEEFKYDVITSEHKATQTAAGATER